jgi:dihydrolipoamide dehydrogenase
VGSGAIGIEFASFYKTLGADVTVVEVLDRVLPVEDEEISAFAAKAFTKQGMKLKVGTTVTELKARRTMSPAPARTRTARPNSHGGPGDPGHGHCRQCREYRLEAAGIKVEKTHIVAGKYGETGVDGVWAIGDLVGGPWLAHKAMHEGVIVARRSPG